MSEVVGFGFVGTPKGLQTKNGGAVKGADIRRYLDLDSSLIRVLPASELLVIRKVRLKKDLYFFVILYEFAKEIQTNRPGTFFGSYVVLKNHTAPPEAILMVLSELSGSLREYIGPKSKRFLAEMKQIPLRVPRRLKGITDNLTAVQDSKFEPKDSVFIAQSGVDDFREKVCLISLCLNEWELVPEEEVYSSDKKEIIQYVRQKKTIDLSNLNLKYETLLESAKASYDDILASVRKQEGILKKITAEVDEQKAKMKVLNEEVDEGLKTLENVGLQIDQKNTILASIRKKEEEVRQKIKRHESVLLEYAETLAKYRRLSVEHDEHMTSLRDQSTKLSKKNELIRQEITKLIEQHRGLKAELLYVRTQICKKNELLNKMPQIARRPK